ncbi:hypothetical protein [Vibrio astriarenae]|uniref:hypothetical protein n=1 Tax=Vibrio astriarenae TaxID=1481923 RepID=UPI003735D283
MSSDEVSNREQSMTNSEIEVFLTDEFNKNHSVALFHQPFSATSLFVPKSASSAEHTFKMTDWSKPEKIVLYKAVIAAYNHAFLDKDAAISAKGVFASTARYFIEWLNSHSIANRYEILKRYEADRMDKLGSHGGYSPLTHLMTILNYAIDSIDFRDEVSSDDYFFLLELAKTKISPNINKCQKSLASYFGAQDWLRRDDIGVGSDIYSALASPKLTVNSLSLTAATVILDLNKYKSALGLLIQYIPAEFNKLIETDIYSLSTTEKKTHIGNTLYHLISAYHQNDDKSVDAKSALDVLLLSNATNEQAYLLMLGALTSQEVCDALFLNQIRCNKKVNVKFCETHITSSITGCLFSWDILSSISRGNTQLITKVENMMFGWLMASLTVQPFDIPKLAPKAFRKMRIGGRVTQIECEYFKSRSRVFHTTRSLSTGEVEGLALLTYLDTIGDQTKLYMRSDINILNGMRSLTGTLRLLLQCDGMNASLRAAHKKRNTPFILPAAYCALIYSGPSMMGVVEKAAKASQEEVVGLNNQTDSRCSKGLFGLQAIKNSAVHAFSDPYTYHYLVNRNSHTNQTEKISYLTEDNEEWMNSAGRITREVMLDLVQNVFALDFNRDQSKEVEAFNSEFMTVSEGVSYKSEEMNARLRLVTGQAQGRVNEVGVLALSVINDDSPLSPIYVLDSPLTVLRMHNYLHEFKKHYRKLLTTNPDLLFKTVMPTVEWMESTLGKMSKQSQQLGREQFDEMIKNGVEMSVFHSL